MRRKAQFMAKPIHAGTDGNSFLRKNYVKQASEAGDLKVSPDGGSEPTVAGGRDDKLWKNGVYRRFSGKQEVFERLFGTCACLREWQRSKFCERVASKEFRAPQQGSEPGAV